MLQPPNKAVTSSHRGLFRSSGIASICAGILILIAFTLIATMGNPTPTGEGYLNYYAAHAWTAKLFPWLFILSDALLLPVLVSLYHTLSEVNKSATPVALGFLGLFVIMDLINLSNVLSFISVSENYAAATSDAQRLAFVAVADYL